jgi:tRNA pseudouridine38-40 synthase
MRIKPKTQMIPRPFSSCDFDAPKCTQPNRVWCNIKLVIAYCGTAYAGWQKTKMGASIEETLEQTLTKILQHEVKLQAASRTDAGVHAEGQVVNFILQKPCDLERLKFSLNCLLPKDIAVLSIEGMPIHFHPTLDSVKKEYWYYICNSGIQLPFYRDISWHFPYALDSKAMCHAANQLEGSHDFSAFCNARKLWDRSPVCHLEKIEICRLENNRLKIVMVGDHFLFRMARNLVGTLAYVGCGKLKAEHIPSLLKGKERTGAGVTAPAHGLALKSVMLKNV